MGKILTRRETELRAFAEDAGLPERSTKSGYELRAFAHDAGLAEDSKFLSHWFGLTDSSSTMEDKLPRPSPWNYFTRQKPRKVAPKDCVFGLRAWSHDAGLPDESQFLSHWFGVEQKASTVYTDLMGPATAVTPWVRL